MVISNIKGGPVKKHPVCMHRVSQNMCMYVLCVYRVAPTTTCLLFGPFVGQVNKAKKEIINNRTFVEIVGFHSVYTCMGMYLLYVSK